MVTRITYTNQNILNMVAEELPDITIGKITNIKTAYTRRSRRFYLPGTPSCLEGSGRTALQAKKEKKKGGAAKTDRPISLDTLLLESTQNVKIAKSSYAEPKVTIDRIADMEQNACDGIIKGSYPVAIEDSGLKIFVRQRVVRPPADENGSRTMERAL